MQKLFLHTIQQIKDYQNKKYLIAISGGLDSVVLSYLFHQEKLHFELAHCNFKLRSKESDDDQTFVEEWANKINTKLNLKVCDLSNQPEKNTQIAARDARYEWFNELKNNQHFDYLVTGHHLDDSIETFFINLQRTAGLKGLTGISETNEILRPLLYFTRKKIHQFALDNDLQWREDSSNASNKYKRNFIRHQIIPKLVEISPSFKKSMRKTLGYLQQSDSIVDDWMTQQKVAIVTEKSGEIFIDVDKLQKLPQKNLFLHHYLSTFGFTDFNGINQLLTAQNGKTILSENYRLINHQNKLILSKILMDANESYQINEQDELKYPVALSIDRIDAKQIDSSTIKKALKSEVYLDYDLLNFPLTLRKWQAGDYFYPLGMKGKMKLSDYYINQKISLVEKEKIWLLCNDKKIVWIVGHRPDDRFKITQHTKNILHIKTD